MIDSIASMKDTLEMKEFVSEMSSTESASAASLKESSDSVSKISSVVCTCV